MSAAVVNRRRFLEAAQALVKTSRPDIHLVKDVIVTLEALINDIADATVRLDLNIVES